MLADELQDLFMSFSNREYLEKFLDGYVAGYATYMPRIEETFMQIFIDPRRRTDRRYTFSINDISAPVMRLDYSISDEELYNNEYDIEAALTEMGRCIKEDLDRFQDEGYDY